MQFWQYISRFFHRSAKTIHYVGRVIVRKHLDASVNQFETVKDPKVLLLFPKHF